MSGISNYQAVSKFVAIMWNRNHFK